MSLIPCEYSTLLKAPEEIRKVLLNSGVIGVNDVFMPLYKEKAFRWMLYGGRGAGRSHHAMDYCDYILDSLPYCRVLFLRFVKDDIRDSLWQGFLDVIKSRSRESEYEIRYHTMRAKHKRTGNEIISKGVRASKSQTAKLKSIAGFTHIFIEESNELPKEDKRKLIDSLRKKDVEIQIIEMFNPPPKFHYVWDDFNLYPVQGEDQYFTAEPKPESNIKAIHATYLDNLHNLNDQYIQRYQTADEVKEKNYVMTDVKGYVSSGGDIMVHPNFTPLDSFPMESIERWIIGLDYGYTIDPSAIIAIGVWGDRRYWKRLGYITESSGDREVANISAENIKEILIQNKMDGWPIYSEHDMDMIAQLRRLKVPVLMANKSVENGIQKVNTFRNYYERHDSIIQKEIQDYKFQKVGEIVLNKPCDGNDHIMNAGRYAIFTDTFRN